MVLLWCCIIMCWIEFANSLLYMNLCTIVKAWLLACVYRNWSLCMNCVDMHNLSALWCIQYVWLFYYGYLSFNGMISDLAVKKKSSIRKRKEKCVNDVINYYDERLWAFHILGRSDEFILSLHCVIEVYDTYWLCYIISSTCIIFIVMTVLRVLYDIIVLYI